MKPKHPAHDTDEDGQTTLNSFVQKGEETHSRRDEAVEDRIASIITFRSHIIAFLLGTLASACFTLLVGLPQILSDLASVAPRIPAQAVYSKRGGRTNS